MSRRKIVAGNWKMNLKANDAIELCRNLKRDFHEKSNIEVFVFPSFVFLHAIKSELTNIQLGAQNFYPKDKGAFTGEISVEQLKDAGVTAVLVGHSERRQYFSENNLFLKEKVNSALENNFTPFFCCGESLEIRESNSHVEFVKKQLEESLFHLDASEIQKVVIAYEPIWAIGTGVTATTEQAEEMHAAIRKIISEKYNQDIANSISILYGGSCNASNAKELFACPNVDGGLIGGASLDANSFVSIIQSF